MTGGIGLAGWYEEKEQRKRKEIKKRTEVQQAQSLGQPLVILSLGLPLPQRLAAGVGGGAGHRRREDGGDRGDMGSSRDGYKAGIISHKIGSSGTASVVEWVVELALGLVVMMV